MDLVNRWVLRFLMIAKVAEITQVLNEPPSGYIENIIFLEDVIQVTDMGFFGVEISC